MAGTPGEMGDSSNPVEPSRVVAPEASIPDGDDTAQRAWLAGARGTPGERSALDAVRREREQLGPLVRTLAAEIALTRGELHSVLRLIDGLSTVGASLVRAAVHERAGDGPRSLDALSAALALDIDAPGALQRYRRLADDRGAPTRAAGIETVLGSEPAPVAIRIVAEAGRGGAGAVYEAFDEALGRPVALKVYDQARRDREQLLREARTAVRLRGRGVVRIFDVDIDRGFVVMEWAMCGALRSHLKRRDTRAVGRADRWAATVLATLARVHESGWIHGDLKPENVLFRGRSEPILADFGSAQRIGEPTFGFSRAYACPERPSHARADPLDDVFALGRILDEALAIEPPADPVWHQVRDRALARRAMRPANAQALCDLAGISKDGGG
jgi:serine/threonine-protein kinase